MRRQTFQLGLNNHTVFFDPGCTYSLQQHVKRCEEAVSGCERLPHRTLSDFNNVTARGDGNMLQQQSTGRPVHHQTTQSYRRTNSAAYPVFMPDRRQPLDCWLQPSVKERESSEGHGLTHNVSKVQLCAKYSTDTQNQSGNDRDKTDVYLPCHLLGRLCPSTSANTLPVQRCRQTKATKKRQQKGDVIARCSKQVPSPILTAPPPYVGCTTLGWRERRALSGGQHFQKGGSLPEACGLSGLKSGWRERSGARNRLEAAGKWRLPRHLRPIPITEAGGLPPRTECSLASTSRWSARRSSGRRYTCRALLSWRV